MWQMPDSIRLATASARWTSRLKTADESPYSVSLATRIASSSPLDAHDRLHRAERFLVVDAHLRRDAVDDGRLDDRAVALAAGDDLGALGLRVGDQFVHALGRRETDERAEHDMAARIAGGQRRGALGELGDEGVGDRLVDDQPLGRHADLALVGEGAEHRRVDRGVEVGVGEHEQRRLAAEFEQHRLQVLGAELGDLLADPRRAGEVDPLAPPDGRSAPRRSSARPPARCEMRLTTPFGKPASFITSTIRLCVFGQTSDERRITVLPQASGAAIARTPRMTGAFHGAMPSTTPAGWRTRHRQHAGLVGGDDLAGDLRRQRRRLAQERSRRRCTLKPPHGPVAPISSVIALEKSAVRASRRSAAFRSSARRSLGPVSDQAGKARCGRLDHLGDVGLARRGRFARDRAGHRIACA